MMAAEFAQSVRQHRDIPLTDISQFPHLAEALQSWQQSAGQRAPRNVDPVAMPRILLPFVMLLDLEENPNRLRVRLAGTYVCQKYGGELKGRTTDDFFSAADARHVVDSALKVARLGIPSLAERTYVNLAGGPRASGSGYLSLSLALRKKGTEPAWDSRFAWAWYGAMEATYQSRAAQARERG